MNMHTNGREMSFWVFLILEILKHQLETILEILIERRASEKQS